MKADSANILSSLGITVPESGNPATAILCLDTIIFPLPAFKLKCTRSTTSGEMIETSEAAEINLFNITGKPGSAFISPGTGVLHAQ